ncbi:TetR family transcriptional regulator [Anaerovibrio lipolyticus]|jgi:AcrR family transcriptional regulator|uniref:TetR family transcriptional regulator n=1 Tax=Anaerovibrio lipolyticus TaxID=82374 RepID=UPI00048762C5|nr:TetR family transcriptional regulator [Anaerovibrio lipolyticus]
MPKVTEEFLLAKREEIIDACAQLYETMSFKDITLKEIANATSLNRTSIYNYFDTKEEIFLAYMQKEYELWIEDLENLCRNNKELSRDELADKLAKTLERRGKLLKLMTMNHFDMEGNSRYESLVEFKKVYGNSIRAVKNCLDKFCQDMNEDAKREFLYVFFPFIYGIYPYVEINEKQREAMDEAKVGFVYHSVYEISYNCLKKLLNC